MKVGLIGLGKMGQQLAARLLLGGHEVIVSDPDADALRPAVEHGARAVPDRAQLVRNLGDHPVVWLMIPAENVEDEMSALLDLMPRGGIIVDGGNSDYRQTKRRAALTAERGVQLVDVGTSGGVYGLLGGFSMMVGGDRDAVAQLEPLLGALAQPSGWAHFGPAGSGHYIKMVHNAIEYGSMEAYAEGFRLLKSSPEFPGLDLPRISQIWQHGSIIASQLNSTAGEVLRANPELNGFDGYVGDSGEVRWATEAAKSSQIPLPAIQAALDVRIASQQGQTNFGTKLLAAMRTAFGGHSPNKP